MFSFKSFLLLRTFLLIHQHNENNCIPAHHAKETTKQLGPKKQIRELKNSLTSQAKNKNLVYLRPSIKTSWKCPSYIVAFHFVFNSACQPPAIASSLLFLPDQAERGCGLNMGSHQQAPSNLPPFASMVPINTLLAPRGEATDSEGDRRGPGVMEKWSAWNRKKGEKKGRGTEIEAENERTQEGGSLLSILNLPWRRGSPAVFNSCSNKRSVPQLSPDTHTDPLKYSKTFDITAASWRDTKIKLRCKYECRLQRMSQPRNCSFS